MSDNNEKQQKPKLYASPETRAYLGDYLVENALEWSGVKKGLLIVTKADLERFEKENGLELPPTVDYEKEMALIIFEKESDNYKRAKSISSNNIIAFFESFQGFPLYDFADNNADAIIKVSNQIKIDPKTVPDKQELLEKIFASLYDNVKSDTAWADCFSMTPGEMQTEYGLIVLYDSVDAKKYLANLAYLPVDSLKETETSAKDVLFGTVVHEIGHVADDGFTKLYLDPESASVEDLQADPLYEQRSGEEFSDGLSIAKTFEACSVGAVDGVGYVHEKVHARAISALREQSFPLYDSVPNYRSTFSYGTHTTSVTMDVAANGNILTKEFNNHDIAAAIFHVNSLAALLAGRVLKDDVSVQEDANLHYEIENPDGVSTNHPLVEFDEGVKKITKDPSVHYAAVRVLLEKGYFKDGSVEHTMAGEFIEGMEALVKPKFLETNDANKLRFEASDMPDATEGFVNKLDHYDPKAVLEGGVHFHNLLFEAQKTMPTDEALLPHK